MKFSFSTRGWKFQWEQLTSIARQMHFDGVELYALNRESSFFASGRPLHPSCVASTMRNLRHTGLEVCCLDSALCLTQDCDTQALRFLLQTAGTMGVSYVSCVALTDDESTIRNHLDLLLPLCHEKNVCLLIKTAGIYADTSRLRNLLDSYADDALAALWDLHHPFADHKESGDTTIRNLGAYVKHVHLRDSAEDGSYTVIGEGVLPVAEMMEALSSIDYDGFVSLEWKPDWIEEFNDYSFIFPHFLNYMGRFQHNPAEKALYRNHDGSGYYVWQKDELIGLTFSQVLDTMANTFPDQLAVKYTTLDYTRTYRQFREDVDRFARGLVSLGVRSGSKVSVWATNIPEWYIAFWATVKIGAVLVSVNTAYKIHEIEYLLRQSDTHTLILIDSCRDCNYKEMIAGLCPEICTSVPGEPLKCKRLPFLRNVITVGYSQEGCLRFEQVMEERSALVPQAEIRRMAAAVRVNDVCNMQYTSGTTGFPKGVMLTHYNVVNNGKCIGDRMGLSTADRMMIQVPMFHCFGMVLSMTASMTHGATICPMPYFSAKNSLACIDQEKITCFNGVPTMFIAMFNHPDYRKTDFSHMRTGIMAGAGCPPELMRRAAQIDEMHMTGIVSVYGQTESAPGSTMSAWTDSLDLRTETVGYAFPHVECKVINPETGEPVPDGTNGEFCSRGYNTMKGYYKMPHATHSTVDAQGWLHSGDLACRNPDGTYRITGRLKDMIIRGGENIYPKEIEEFIYTHPAVEDVQVIGVPDAKYGEEAMAQIILKEGTAVTAEEMRKFIAASLASHKVPRYIEFVSAFPMNAAGKVLKYKMREDAVKRLGL